MIDERTGDAVAVSVIELPTSEPDRKRCEVCGFVSAAAPGQDSVATILALPGRFRALFTACGRPERIDDLVHARCPATGWSAIEYAAHVAEVLHETSLRLMLVFDRVGRVLPPPHVEAASALARTASPVAVLASLGAAAANLARVVGRAEPGAWELSARRGDTLVTARALLGEALHEAHHHLYDAETALRAASDTNPIAG